MTIDRTFEEKLALRFAPTYISSAGEDRYLAELEPVPSPKVALGHPPPKPYIYFSVFKHPPKSDQDSFEINYLSIWDWDAGGLAGLFVPHQWDTERTAILIQGPKGDADPTSFLAIEAYFAAHEGTAVNASTYNKPQKKDRGVTVYCSLGKHASYPTHPPLFMALVDQINPPEERAEPPAYILKNAGTLDKPTESAPWISYKDDWGPDRVSSVYSKLKDPLWGPTPRPSNWLRSRPATLKANREVVHIQEALNLSPNGIIDPALFSRLRILSPELVRNSSLMDRELLARAVSLHPVKASPARMAPVLNREVTLRSMIAPKEIEGLMAGSKGAKAVNLGQLPGLEMILYGLIRPDGKEIFDIMAAPVATITKSRLSSTDLAALGKK